MLAILPAEELPPAKKSPAPWQAERSGKAQAHSTGENSPLAIASGSNLQKAPAVAYNPIRREFLVVWVEDNGQNSTSAILARRIDENGVPLSASFSLADVSGKDADRLEIAHGGENDLYVLAWSQPNGGVSAETYCNEDKCKTYTLSEYDLYALSIQGDGSVQSAAARVTDQLTYHGSREVIQGHDIIYNAASNEFILAWQQPRGGLEFITYSTAIAYPHRIVGQRLNASGALTGAQEVLASMVGNNLSLGCGNHGECMVLFSRWFPSYDLTYAQALSANLVPWALSSTCCRTAPPEAPD